MSDEGQTLLRAIRARDLEGLAVGGADGKCVVCGRPVTPHSAGGFVKRDGQLRLICERGDCLRIAVSGTWPITDRETART